MSLIQITPIGFVTTNGAEPQGDDWSKVVSTIEVAQEFVPGLQGLTDWSHVVVIYAMHAAAFDRDVHLVRRPRADMPEVGIFAQRARYHPNTIGITAVRLLNVDGGTVQVKGLDAINGSPVLDLKPYAPIYDGVQDPLVPAWFIQLMQDGG